MRYFSIDPPAKIGEIKRIVGPDVKHIRNVLRLKSGDEIVVIDGKGFEYEARIVEVASKHIDLMILKRYYSKSESPIRITVAQAYLKDKKMDILIRQLTELGIHRWIPFYCDRSIPRPEKKRLPTRVARWRKIAGEAVKQCRRGAIPEIGDITSFEDLVNMSQAFEIKFIFWEKESLPIQYYVDPGKFNQQSEMLMVMGPEGGFTDQEIDFAKNKDFCSVGLGPRVLRAETATIVACTLIQYMLGDLGEKNLDKNTTL